MCVGSMLSQQAAGSVPVPSCWPGSMELLGLGWFVPGWGHSTKFTACSCGSLWMGKEGMWCLFAYFKPNGHSPEASQRAGNNHPVLGTQPSLCACHVQPDTFNRGFQKQRCCFSEGTRRELSSGFSLAFSSYICSVRVVFRPSLSAQGIHHLFQNGFGLKGANILYQTQKNP